MTNLTNMTDSEARELASTYESKNIPIRSKWASKVYFVAEWFEKIVLRVIQSTAKTTENISKRICEAIDERIGEEADIPDFFQAYPIEQIIAMAVAYPLHQKTTLEAISNHFTISKRQAIRVQNEIKHGFPSFPAGKRIWEIYHENPA